MAKVSDSIQGLSLAAIIGFFLVIPCVAEPLLLELANASAGHDQRTGQPVLRIVLTGVSKQAMYYLSVNSIGKKFELRTDGHPILSSFFREPISGGTVQISGADLTSERINELVQELSKPGIRVEIDEAVLPAGK
jgi:hypothetical protein